MLISSTLTLRLGTTLFSAVIVAAIALTAAPAGACACGIALEASVVEERAIVIERDGREEIVASFDLLSDGAGPAAVVFPVPGRPSVEAVKGDPLTYLDLATAPEPAVTSGTDGATAGGQGAGVDVISREEIGGYDVTRLDADDPEALESFLDENGYTLPDGAGPILAGYVEQGWSYVAIKLADDSDGRLKPLRISFPTSGSGGSPVYPMKLTQLGSEPVDLTLYVLADGERSVDGLETVYDGPVADLEPAPDPEVAELIDSRSYLTKLTATGVDPGRFSEDLVVEGGESGSGAGHSLIGLLLLLFGLLG